VLEKRTELVAGKITEFLKATDPFAKTIVFCEDIDHAERMRQALVNLNPDLIAENRKYVMRITGDNRKARPNSTTSSTPRSPTRSSPPPRKLMTTGVDAQTCKLIVLDQRIQSMTEFKQIIGRGTRINEDYGKLYFTIMDFKKATSCSPIPTSTAIESIEDIKILTLDPFSRLGTAPELVAAFGGKSGYLKAVQELEQQLYA
jgi:type I restriction enzyme R subunit